METAMPVIVTVIDHQEDGIYGFKLNRPHICSLTDPEFAIKEAAFFDDLRLSGLAQVASTYSSGGHLTLLGVMPGDEPSRYVKIIDVFRAHLDPPAKELLSTFMQKL